jgi:diguanylate cyclase (GGDEF)-like protein
VADVNRKWFFSLRTKLVATLVSILVAVALVAVIGLESFLGDFFEHIAESEASQLGHAIRLGLRHQMLREPGASVESSLEDLRPLKSLERVWVIDKNSRVAYATDHLTVGRVFDRRRDRACVGCHTREGTQVASTSFATNERSVPIIRYVDVVPNEQPCWGCHDPKQRINGIVLVELSTETFREALATVRSRLAITALTALVVFLGASLGTLAVIILRPVRRLVAGVARLGSGDLAVRIPEAGRDELAALAGAFNTMTGDLKRHIDDIQNKTAELSVVYAILGRLTKSIDLAELRDIVLQAFLQVWQAEQSVLLIRRHGESSIEAVSRTIDEVRARRIRGDEQGEVGLPPGFPPDIVDRWRRGDLRAPVVSADLTVAVLPIQTALQTSLLLMVRRERPFSDPETNPKLLAMVAEHVGVAFNNAELYSQAITDELTRLFTVRHFYERIHECAAQYSRDGRGFCVLMIDLDHFKSVNDRWGHPAGDAVLRAAAAMLQDSVRIPDSGYRYGGDELSALLPGAAIAAGRDVAERLRSGIEKMQVTLSTGDVIGITVSIGIAACPDHGTSAEELVAAADSALYASKRSGRNHVALPPPLS